MKRSNGTNQVRIEVLVKAKGSENTWTDPERSASVTGIFRSWLSFTAIFQMSFPCITTPAIGFGSLHEVHPEVVAQTKSNIKLPRHLRGL